MFQNKNWNNSENRYLQSFFLHTPLVENETPELGMEYAGVGHGAAGLSAV